MFDRGSVAPEPFGGLGDERPGPQGPALPHYLPVPLSCENAATVTLVPIVKLDFVGLCRALDLVGLCYVVGLRRGSFERKLAVSPAQNTPINPRASVAER